MVVIKILNIIFDKMCEKTNEDYREYSTSELFKLVHTEDGETLKKIVCELNKRGYY